MHASKILLFSLLLVILATTKPAAIAVEPTASESATIQNLRKAVQEKVTTKLKEISQTTIPNKRAWQGQIKQIDPVNILLDVSGQDKTLALSESTVFIDGAKNKIDPAKFKIGQTILALGYTKDNLEMDTKRVILVNPNVSVPKFTVTSGQISDISKTSQTLVLVPTFNKNKEIQVVIDAKTNLLNINQKVLLYPDLYKSQKVVAILSQKDKTGKVFFAQTIIALSQKPTPTPSIAKSPTNR